MHRGLWLDSKLFSPGRVAAAGAATAVGAAFHHRERLQDLRLGLNSTLIEGLSGAAGEVAQIALVYPLDTIKVRCQAAGWGSRKVLANLWSSTGGDLRAMLAALYAGALPAAMLSILVGSVHYCSFCATRRTLISLETAAATAGVGGLADSQDPSSSSSSSSMAGKGEPQQHILVSHGVTGTHFLLEEEQVREQQPNITTSSRGHSSGSSSSSSSSSHSPSEPEGSMTVNILSAVITAAITALVEAPLELFRHNSQAGQISGNFVRAMWNTLRRNGPRSLYLGFVPYCFESWPYDISELLVIGAGKGTRHLLPHVAPAAYDMAIGGMAGAIAVLVSMPFDVIKTHIQTNASAAAGAEGLAGSTAVFWRTGQQLVARGGPGQLFVGLVPRLCHQVPGAMVCWLVIESCQRFLLGAAAAAELANDSTPSAEKL